MTQRGYEFVDRIKRQVDQGGLEIACFPEVANELIRHLDSEFVSVNDIAGIVTHEAALAIRVIGMANSAAYRSDTSDRNGLTFIRPASKPIRSEYTPMQAVARTLAVSLLSLAAAFGSVGRVAAADATTSVATSAA